MAKRHLRSLIMGLSQRYSEAQSLFEDAAEAISESMVDPEVYDGFCNKKNSLDIQLSNLSRILEISLDREKFLKAYSKIILTHSRIVQILDNLKNEETKEGFIDSDERRNLIQQYIELEEKSVYSVMLYRVIDSVASVKNRNRKYSISIDIFGIDEKLEDLKMFIREKL